MQREHPGCATRWCCVGRTFCIFVGDFVMIHVGCVLHTRNLQWWLAMMHSAAVTALVLLQ